jgi:hypothetical protein
MTVLSPAEMKGGAVLSPAAVGGRRRRSRKGKVTKKARKMMRTLAKMTGRKIKMMGGEGEVEEVPAAAGTRRHRPLRLRSRRPRSLFF